MKECIYYLLIQKKATHKTKHPVPFSFSLSFLPSVNTSRIIIAFFFLYLDVKWLTSWFRQNDFVRLIDWHFPEVRKSIDLNENQHDASNSCVVCSWKSRVSVWWPPWRHDKTTDPHGSVTSWTKLNRKQSGKSVLKHAERVCCSWLQWKVDKGVFFTCFSFKKNKYIYIYMKPKNDSGRWQWIDGT